ncbi:MAG: carbohydrate kinase family protein [Candidatus Bathyarchaeota archaeon]|nr:MAG: carbohydrate kinase family protein [Candidatus Bathyarchaeota archaeon]
MRIIKFDIVCIGHVLYDIRCYVNNFPSPDKLAVIMGRLKSGIGGSTANSAVAASKLGLECGIIGKIGFDEYGWSVIQSFRDYGINMDHVLVDFSNPTGVSLITVDKDGTPEFVQMIGASEPISPEEIRPEYIGTSKHLHMTGLNMEALIKSSQIAKDYGKTVSFDPGRKKSDLGYKVLLPILENVDILLVNQSEAKILLGAEKDAEITGVMKKLRERIGKHKIFVAKGGYRNLHVYSPEGDFSISPFNVKVVDTIGAGDAFDGSFITAFLRGESCEDAAIYGAACGSLKCECEGAQSGPNKEKLEAFVKENRKALEITRL